MADVTLTLTANTDQYVKGINDAQKATQNLYTTAEKGEKRQKGLIEDLKDAIAGYQKSLDKAMTTEQITKYNQKLTEANKELKEYQQLGVKTEQTTQSMTSSISKWVLSLGGATVILKKLKDAFLETTGGMNLFNKAGSAMKAVLNDIVTTGTISIGTIKQAIQTQGVLNDLRLEEGVRVLRLQIKYINISKVI